MRDLPSLALEKDLQTLQIWLSVSHGEVQPLLSLDAT